MKYSDMDGKGKMKEKTMAKEKTVVIEVDGDGYVELVTKPKGIKVIIKDWDNADPQDAPEPEIREYAKDIEVIDGWLEQ